MFSNKNYDQIDNFIFDRLDDISDEATAVDGTDVPVILICVDRRTKSEPLLVKLFGIGIYNAILGQDRSIEEVCRLINKPRSKKEAKLYYKIESDEVSYQAENEDYVSEVEIQNILTHYKRLGNEEGRYIESFNNIAAQYTDAQLRVIASVLPLRVKAVLETSSKKYQSIMTFGEETYKPKTKLGNDGKNGTIKMGFIESEEKKKVGNKPIVVPSGINKDNVKKVLKKTTQPVEEEKPEEEEVLENANREIEIPKVEVPEVAVPKVVGETEIKPKKGRGRPKKNIESDSVVEEVKPKKGRGRPKKKVEPEETEILDVEEKKEDVLSSFDIPEKEDLEETILPGFDEDDEEEEDSILPGFDEEDDVEDEEEIEDEEEDNSIFPGFDEEDDVEDEEEIEDEEEDNSILPGFDEEDDVEDEEEIEDEEEQQEYSRPMARKKETPIFGTSMTKGNKYGNTELEIGNLITKDKKLVTFVGTSKNGTSFIVNNLAKLFSDMGVKTAILDVTKNRNSYYIYTKNEETLRKKAFSCFEKLRAGKPEGIQVNKNLTVYTALPDEENEIEDVENILSTLLKNYSLVLIDCDFGTPVNYFRATQEIYLVQSLDVLTIQPLTAFLRELKSQNVELRSKIRIIINKNQNVRNLSAKAIIGGMAFYNDPAMTFMTELFDKNNAQYCTLPFETEVYIKYLEDLVNCQITVNEYSKEFLVSLRDLGNMVYPMVDSKYKPPVSKYGKNNKFSSNMNSALDQMKKKY